MVHRPTLPVNQSTRLPYTSRLQGCQVLQSKIYQNVPNNIPKYVIKNLPKFRKKIINLSVKMKSVAFLNNIINFLLNLPTEVFLLLLSLLDSTLARTATLPDFKSPKQFQSFFFNFQVKIRSGPIRNQHRYYV